MPPSSSALAYDAKNRISTGSASSLLSPTNRRPSHSQPVPQHHRLSFHSQTIPESPNNSTYNWNSNINGSKSNLSSNNFPITDTSASKGNSLFVGINLPADRPNIAHPYTDRALVDSAITSDYNMITSRISSPAYQRRIETLYSQTEEAWSLAIAANRNPSSNRRTSYQQGPYSYQRATSSAHSVASRNSSTASWYHVRSASGASSASYRNRIRSHLTRSPDLHPFDSISVPPLGLDDILLLPGSHLQNVIALAAPWAELDSKNPSIAALSIQVVVQEVAYAAYCGVVYIVLPGPKRRTNVEQYASAVAQVLATASSRVQLLVNLPFAEDDYVSSRTGIHVPPADHLSIWDVWNTVRTITNYPSNLSVALQIPPKCSGLPPAVANRWYAEPVKMLTLSASIFMANAKKYPVLPKATQNLLFRFFAKSPFIMLADVYDPREFSGGPQSYLLYVRHLLRVCPKPSLVDTIASGCADVLQLPLQHLAQNLENSEYETYERDFTKYNIYEKAIAAALLDISKPHIEVAVAGAGRGPLVEKTLNAAATVGKTVHIYAIEKNASACIHLARRREFEWTPENLVSSSSGMVSSVDVVHSDLRSWRPPNGASSRVHLIISELLGSFGDNELSPECLDALDNTEVLDPKCGIIIPQEYAAWFTPVMSPELYKKASKFELPTNNAITNSSLDTTTYPSAGTASNTFRHSEPAKDPLNSSSAFHRPYVVHLNSVDYVAPSQYAKAWVFSHPSPMGACLASAETSAEIAYGSNSADHNSVSYPTPVGRGSSLLYPNVNKSSSRVSSGGAAAFRANALADLGVGGGNSFNTGTGKSAGPDFSTSFVSSPSRGAATNPTNASVMSLTATAAAEAAKVAAETATAVKTLFSAASKNLANTRKTKHTFKIPNQCVIHGLAGFFECRLYGNIGFSTRPDIVEENGNGNGNGTMSSTSVFNDRSDTPLSYIPDSDDNSENDYNGLRTANGNGSMNGGNMSSTRGTAFGIPQTKDMTSWFPMWFPFSQPTYINEQSEVDVTMWRRTDGGRVWYEWTMESFISSGRLAAQTLGTDTLEDLAKASAMVANINNNNGSNISSFDYDVDMTEEGHLRRMKQVADKYLELQAKRRIRTGITELHNSGGVHYSVRL